MKTILEKIYCNNFGPEIKLYGPSNIAEFTGLKESLLEKLMKTLNDPEKELFEKYCGAQAELEDIARYEKFTYGFRLGVRIMADALIDGENVL